MVAEHTFKLCCKGFGSLPSQPWGAMDVQRGDKTGNRLLTWEVLDCPEAIVDDQNQASVIAHQNHIRSRNG